MIVDQCRPCRPIDSFLKKTVEIWLELSTPRGVFSVFSSDRAVTQCSVCGQWPQRKDRIPCVLGTHKLFSAKNQTRFVVPVWSFFPLCFFLPYLFCFVWKWCHFFCCCFFWHFGCVCLSMLTLFLLPECFCACACDSQVQLLGSRIFPLCFSHLL